MNIRCCKTKTVLAAIGMLSLGTLPGMNAETVVAENTLDIVRPQETIEIPWSSPTPATVLENGSAIPSQMVEGKLLFQSDFAAGQKKEFTVKPAAGDAPAFPVRAYGRHVPERLDDYAWENDRIAFRVYGPALMQKPPKGEGLVSSSVDVWVKRTRNLVINKWYQGKHYHKDSGEGLDNYKCGTGRGCGGIGVWADGKLLPSANWATQKTIANGPVRTVFELGYAAWECGNGVKIRESRRVSLDAGANLNRFESVFTIEGAESAQIAVGLDVSKEHKHAGLLEGGAAQGWFANWEAEMKPNGSIASATLLPAAQVTDARANGQAFLIAAAKSGTPFVWYAGAGWSKSGDFADAAAWRAYIESAMKRIRTPLKTTVGN